MFSKTISASLALSLLLLHATAQVTLTGCHLHEGPEVCLLPGGAETRITDAAASPAAVTPTPTAPISVSALTTAVAQTTAITDCHNHGTTQYCVKGDGEEVQVMATATGNFALPTAYNGCHSHVAEIFCIAPDGSEVEVVTEVADHDHSEEESHKAESSKPNCHFHAGVEHCVGGEKSESSCSKVDREYNIPLRIGLLFVMFVTSAIGVYLPFFMKKAFKIESSSIIFTIGKQFGTGIIVSTALVHLLTHAELMFSSDCIGELNYEATTTAIALAGAFVTFCIEYTTRRLANRRRDTATGPNLDNQSSNEEIAVQSSEKTAATTKHDSHHNNANIYHSPPNNAISVLSLETGIIFHSLLIGITLVVAGDSGFITLFIVIIFHQAFEGLALGSRIADVQGLSNTMALLLPMVFALVTPIGMAIGIGVLNNFNGNDRTTIIVLGTLDAFSAGILLWVGLVSMWAHDWLYGDLRDVGILGTGVAFLSLICGFVLMGVLGKWA